MDKALPAQNVAYAAGYLQAWVDSALQLDKDGIAAPKIWLGGEYNRTMVQAVFPDLQFIDHVSLWESQWESTEVSEQAIAVDEAIAAELSPYWDRLMSLAARSLVASPKIKQYSQIRHRIYVLYAYFKGLLLERGIESVIFAESPHNIPYFLMYVVARNAGLRTPMFVRTGLGDRVYLTTDIGQKPIRWTDDCVDSCAEETASILHEHPDVEETLVRLRKEAPEDNVPVYMKWNERREKEVVEKSRRRARSGLRRLTTIRPRHLTQASKWPSYLGVVLESAGLLKSEKETEFSTLKSTYDGLVIDRISEPYVLVCLHYQPEKTTNPDGGIFDEQAAMIRTLSKALPTGWTICVKEHPTQFYSSYFGRFARTPDFYTSLSKIPNVEFASADLLAAELMSSAVAIATVTGMAGFEAAVRGIPVLAFGMPWYYDCPGVHFVRTLSQVKAAIDKISVSSETAKTSCLDSYVGKLLKCCIKGYVIPGAKRYSDIPETVLATQLASELRLALCSREE